MKRELVPTSYTIGEIPLYWSTLRDVECGAAPCRITLFGYPTDAWAVATKSERWLTTRDAALEWLMQRTFASREAVEMFFNTAESHTKET